MKNKFLSSGISDFDRLKHSGMTETRRKQGGVSFLKTRTLTNVEISILKNHNNISDDWSQIHVKEPFDPDLVRNCCFHGFIRIGRLERAVLRDEDRIYYCGLENSVIISSDIGDYCCVENNSHISHIITGNYVVLSNNNEIYTTENAKFGNCIRKEGDPEGVIPRVEVINERGSRGVCCFSGILAADMMLWARYRDRTVLMERLEDFTNEKFDPAGGYYSFIDDHSVVKNTASVSDLMAGRSSMIKGASRVCNITINSRSENPSSVLDNCIAVNGIIGEGSCIESSSTAENFVLGDFCTLKLGARFIHSYLGDYSTVGCCEVLNSLIYPCHEQHHNSSFLIASAVMGQSNIASGATIGSNHNSRMNDCELWAKRGFWPGLCSSFKHNSRFASFCLLAKSDFPYELDIRFPFSLVNNDEYNNCLEIIPAYWWLYNMYALIRNFFKFKERGDRGAGAIRPEFDFMAPDTAEEIISALDLIEKKRFEAIDIETESKSINLEISSEGVEGSGRDVRLLKINKAVRGYREMLLFYCGYTLFSYIYSESGSLESLMEGDFPSERIRKWENFGGQIIPDKEIEVLIGRIESGEIVSWDDIHNFFEKEAILYPSRKLSHAVSVLFYLYDENVLSERVMKRLENEYREILESIDFQIHKTRKKDYSDNFRNKIFRNVEEMEKVLGKLEDDPVTEKFRSHFVDMLNR